MKVCLLFPASVSGGLQVAFTASMSPRTNCFGPFIRNTPIRYDVITLNQGSGYNPALGKCSQTIISTPYKTVAQPWFMRGQSFCLSD